MILLSGMSVFADEEANYLVSRDIVYGDAARPESELQSLDLYWQDNLEQRPVIIYIHDGAWALGDKDDVHKKPSFFARHGFSFISMNYRLRWEASLLDQLEDIVSVIRWVKDNASQYGLDPERVVLMGHGAGAHLAALVATQPPFVDTSGIDFEHIRAVVAIDSDSYDITWLMKETGSYLDRRRHRLIFGEDEKAWRSASPVTYVDAEKVLPPFALLYVPNNSSTTRQTRAFSRALREVDAKVIMIPGNEKTTETIDEELGTPRDAPSLALVAFLRAAI